MKLEAGKDVYPLREFGEMALIAVDTGVREMTGYCYVLRKISLPEWLEVRGDRSKPPLVGIPICYAIAPTSDGLFSDVCLYPAPDKDYDLTGRYYPAQRPL